MKYMKLFEELEEAQKEVKISKDNNDLDACIEACKKCADICKRCAEECDSKDMEKCSKICEETSMMLELCATAGLNDSIRIKDLCKMAMDYCKECMNSCEECGSDICVECSETCNMCLEAIFEYAQNL